METIKSKEYYTKEEAIEMYLDGVQVRTISKGLKISESTFIRRLKEMGLYKRKNNIPFTESEKNQMIEMRKSGYGKEYIANEIGLPVKRVESYIDSLDIPYKKRTPTREDNNLYALNIDYFNTIDIQDKAYWLGFIMADGSLSDYRLTIRLSYTDYEHLKEFKKAIQFSGNIVVKEESTNFKKRHKSCTIELNSRDLVEGLSQYMPIGKKSDKIELPNIDSNLMNHFIRGYFDGDGYIVRTRKHMGICGIPKFLTEISELFLSEGLRKEEEGYMSNVNKEETYGELRYSKRATERILEWIYSGAKTYLKRKYDDYYN